MRSRRRAPARPRRAGRAGIRARARRGTWQNDPRPPCGQSERSQPASMGSPVRLLVLLAAALVPSAAHATDVNVIGLFPGKAVVVVNRGAPRTLSVGQGTSEGVRLLSVD